MCDMCGCNSTEFMGVKIMSPSVLDVASQGDCGITDQMVHTAEETSRFGMGDN